MNTTYRIFLFGAILAIGVFPKITAAARTHQGPTESLYEGFEDPPHDYDLIPLWTWNGQTDVNQAKRQIDEMLAKGVKRVIVYPFPNMRVRFLSDALGRGPSVCARDRFSSGGERRKHVARRQCFRPVVEPTRPEPRA